VKKKRKLERCELREGKAIREETVFNVGRDSFAPEEKRGGMQRPASSRGKTEFVEVGPSHETEGESWMQHDRRR